MKIRSLCTLLMSITLMAGAHAQGKGPSRGAAQAEGAQLGSSLINSPTLNPAALSQTGSKPGASNVWGDAYTGQADEMLTGKKQAPSLIGVGNEARMSAQTTFGGYDNKREQQGMQATYFLDRNPIVKPQLSPNDPMLGIKLGRDPAFESVATKTCQQVAVGHTSEDEQPYECIQSYVPYVVPCAVNTTVTIGQGPGCTPGQELPPFRSPYPCNGCNNIDHYLNVLMTCGASGAGMNMRLYTSADADGKVELFSAIPWKSVPMQPGQSSGDILLGDPGVDCRLPFYVQQDCNGTECIFRVKLIGATCPLADYVVSQKLPAPFAQTVTETSSSSCSALEGLAQ